jgi:hypothetical protein
MFKSFVSFILAVFIFSLLQGQNRKLVPFQNRDGSYIMVDSTNMKIAFPLKLDFAYPFSDRGWAAKDQKWGILDFEGDFIIKPTYDDLVPINEKLAIVSNNGKSGLLKIDGTKITDLIFKSIKITDQFLKVSKLVKVGSENAEVEVWGIIDFNGNELVPCDYEAIKKSRKTNLLIKGDYVVFANYYGKKISDTLYDDPGYADFSRTGKMIVSKNYNFGLIDSFGHELTPFKYSYLDQVRPLRRDRFYTCHYIGTVTNAKDSSVTYVLLDSTGKEYYQGTEEILNDIAFRGFSVYQDSLGLRFTNGVITKTIGEGEVRIGDIKYFRNDFFALNTEFHPTDWSFFDNNGNLLSKFQADSLGKYTDGLISAKRNSKWGVLDLKNKQILPFIYNNIEILDNGLMKVNEAGKIGIIDKYRKFILPLGYDSIQVLGDEDELFSVKKLNKFALFNKNGTALTSDLYDKIDDSDADLSILIVSNEHKYGLLSLSGIPITKLEFDKIDDSDAFLGILIVTKNNKVGIVNLNGQELVPIKYDEIEVIAGEDDKRLNFAIVKLNGKYGIFECGAREIIAPNFEEEDLSMLPGFIYINSDSFLPGYFVDLKGREYREK